MVSLQSYKQREAGVVSKYTSYTCMVLCLFIFVFLSHSNVSYGLESENRTGCIGLTNTETNNDFSKSRSYEYTNNRFGAFGKQYSKIRFGGVRENCTDKNWFNNVAPGQTATFNQDGVTGNNAEIWDRFPNDTFKYPIPTDIPEGIDLKEIPGYKAHGSTESVCFNDFVGTYGNNTAYYNIARVQSLLATPGKGSAGANGLNIQGDTSTLFAGIGTTADAVIGLLTRNIGGYIGGIPTEDQHQAIRKLQASINLIGCTNIMTDGKLGNYTIKSFCECGKCVQADKIQESCAYIVDDIKNYANGKPGSPGRTAIGDIAFIPKGAICVGKDNNEYNGTICGCVSNPNSEGYWYNGTERTCGCMTPDKITGETCDNADTLTANNTCNAASKGPLYCEKNNEKIARICPCTGDCDEKYKDKPDLAIFEGATCVSDRERETGTSPRVCPCADLEDFPNVKPGEPVDIGGGVMKTVCNCKGEKVLKTDPETNYNMCVCGPDSIVGQDGSCKTCPEGKKPNSRQTACECEDGCCGIKLNTNVPWIGRCIEFGNTNDRNETVTNDYNNGNTTITVNLLNAFPLLMSGLGKIMLTVILLFSFGSLIYAGMRRTSAGIDSNGKQEAIALIWKVVTAIALVGASGVILHIINPNFFQ